MPDEVWFAIPSASVERCRLRLPAWRERGYRVAVLQNRERGGIPADRVVWSDHYPGWAESVNILCRDIVPESAPVVVTGGDDMLPEPTLSAESMLERFAARLPNGFGVYQPTGDAHMNAREYCGSPWLGRAWIDRAYGGRGPMWGAYRHNWADHELYWVAGALGVLAEDAEVAQHHEHFTRTGEAPPAFWEDAVRAHDRGDVERFIARLWMGFPGHEPVGGRGMNADWWRERYPGLAERYWATRYGRERVMGDSARRMGAALREAADRGHRRVGVYGAGTETRAAGDAFLEPPVEVVAFIDDASERWGGRLWGFPVISREEAETLGLDAVVLASRSMQDTLAQRAAPIVAVGAALIPLYPESISNAGDAARRARAETIHG